MAVRKSSLGLSMVMPECQSTPVIKYSEYRKKGGRKVMMGVICLLFEYGQRWGKAVSDGNNNPKKRREQTVVQFGKVQDP